MGPTGGEGAKQWMNMLTELRNCGVQDVYIVCCDGLKGLPDAIGAIWPLATVQTCVVHLVRNSLRYASKKYWSKITGQLREVYTAPTVEEAEARFAEFAEQWRSLYPAMIQMWENAWGEFTPFLLFPPEIRRLIYTTNGIESLNARFQQATRRRGHFPNEQAGWIQPVNATPDSIEVLRDGKTSSSAARILGGSPLGDGRRRGRLCGRGVEDRCLEVVPTRWWCDAGTVSCFPAFAGCSTAVVPGARRDRLSERRRSRRSGDRSCDWTLALDREPGTATRTRAP